MWDGKPLVNSNICVIVCCHFCPWVCGCTKQMALQGPVPISLPGHPDLCFVVNGAYPASEDLAIAEETLTSCGFAKDASNVWVKAADQKASAPAPQSMGN
uniref:Uncharacterized protein n=1 Tax=Alexandrium monilatum TaxID=311494 RepID=A0A7S4SDJ9_9DINO